MNIFERLWFKAKTGVSIVDIGRADEVVIRYKNKFISILEEPDSGEIRSLGWSSGTISNTPIRDYWIARPPKGGKHE